MSSPLRILSLEDDPKDAELVQETLAGDGISCVITRVETEADFIASLEQGNVDLILADYTLPSFDGQSALKIARQDWPQVPFIFVSGTLDEEVAIEALKIGATDYVFKTRLSRIVPSVQRALREAGEKAELSHAEEALQRSEAYLAEAQRLSHTGSFGWDVSSGEIYWSRETFRIFDYEPAAAVSIEMVMQRTHPEDRSAVQQLIDRVSHERKDFDFEHRLLMPDGSVKYVRVVGHPSEERPGSFEFVGAVTDITERKRAEGLVAGEKRLFEMVARGDALAPILDALCRLVEELLGGALVSILLVSADSKSLRHGAAPSLPRRYTEAIGGGLIGPRAGSCGTAAYREELVVVSDIESDPLWADYRHLALAEGLRACWSTPIFSTKRKVLGTLALYCREPATPTPEQHSVVERFAHLASIAIERTQAQEALRRSEAYLAEAQRLSHTGSWACNPATGEIRYWSEETYRLLGFDPVGPLPRFETCLQHIHPDDQVLIMEGFEKALRERAEFELDFRITHSRSGVGDIHLVGHPVLSPSGDLVEFVGTMIDITERKAAEERLRQLVDFVPQVIIVLAPDGKGIHANRVALEYTNLTLDDFQSGDVVGMVTHPDDLENVRNERARGLRAAEPFEIEARLRGKDGVYRWFLFRYNPLVEHGSVSRWYATGTEIEARKQAEERVQKENLALREEIDKTSMFEEIVGESLALQAVLARVAKVAPTDSTVLITGETGTGKELIARAIHKRSRRASRAFVSVNCAATPATLIASELFGHEKGAFTGALQRRLGRFELAEGGTIFLDEIGELPAETQIALLRVLQEREFDRVGGSHPIRADVRVIAASNRDLESAIAGGAFRRDLFYRLNVFPIEMPPLRERKEDIPTLIEYFIHRYARKAGKKIRTIEKETLELLESYAWPGNIRELQNVIERSVIVCETDLFSVDPSWLSFESSSPRQDGEPIARKSAAQERAAIETALAASAGRVSGPSGAAAQLSMPPSTLESKIRSLKINKFRFKKV
jgi:PAS domain S-box-containing protein